MIVAIATGSAYGSSMMRASAAAGMAAAVMILLQMISSGRFETVSARIGIDVTIAFHKWAAPVALALALAHIVLLVGLPDPQRPDRFARRLDMVLSGQGLWDARLAFFLLIAITILALFRDYLPIRYEIWRASHALAALGLIAAMVAHVTGDGAGATGWLWLGLTIGVTLPAASVYARRLLRPVGSLWRIAENRKVADRLWYIVIGSPSGRRLDFRPGQFAWAAFGVRRLPLHDHPLSFASAPGDDALAFLVQERGDFTRTIGTLPPGTPVSLDAPHGSFGPRFDSGPILLIAGGAGIAPILSVLRHLAQTGSPRPVQVIYAARSAAAMVPTEMLAPACERLGIRPVLLAEEGGDGPALARGPLQEKHLRDALRGADPATVEALICGPDAMMTFAADTLERLGVPASRIAYERFSYSVEGMARKDRKMLLGFAGVFGAIAAMIVAYSLT